MQLPGAPSQLVGAEGEEELRATQGPGLCAQTLSRRRLYTLFLKPGCAQGSGSPIPSPRPRLPGARCPLLRRKHSIPEPKPPVRRDLGAPAPGPRARSVQPLGSPGSRRPDSRAPPPPSSPLTGPAAAAAAAPPAETRGFQGARGPSDSNITSAAARPIGGGSPAHTRCRRRWGRSCGRAPGRGACGGGRLCPLGPAAPRPQSSSRGALPGGSTFPVSSGEGITVAIFKNTSSLFSPEHQRPGSPYGPPRGAPPSGTCPSVRRARLPASLRPRESPRIS